MNTVRNNWLNMTTRFLLSAVICGTLLLGAAGERTVRAQETAPVAASPKNLTIEELKTIFENLGYEPQEDKVGDKINLLYMQWKQGTFQYVMYASISNDGNDLILQAPLKSLPADETAYGKELAAMMSKGFMITPSHFVVDESRGVRLLRFVPNQGLTAVKVRKVVGDFTEQVRSTEAVWRCDHWEANATLVAKPVVQK